MRAEAKKAKIEAEKARNEAEQHGYDVEPTVLRLGRKLSTKPGLRLLLS